MTSGRTSRIEASLREFSPEPILCWCTGQSLESRYAPLAVSGGGGLVGLLIGQAIVRRKLRKARHAQAVPMPRYPVIAAGATQIFIFDGPLAKRGPFATLQRDQAEILHRGDGPMRRRLDIIVPANGTSHVYTMICATPFGGAEKLRRLVSELTNGRDTSR